MMSDKIRLLIWNENEDEKRFPDTLKIYPGGIHGVLESFLKDDFAVKVATWDQDDTHGLSDEVLDHTDVLIWYSHLRNEIPKATLEKLVTRVFDGMGVIFLHSGALLSFANILLGPSSRRGAYREQGELERLWVINRAHPITDGVPDHFEVQQSEMYPEPRDIPTPDDLIFISWFEGGEVLRSGYTYIRGAGKVFCFLPGHSTFPVYYQPEIQTVIKNGVRWCAPLKKPPIQSRSGEVDFDYRTIAHNI
jgi:trehalose utilization protein